jgi:S-DNA-T family DNA segregation ATPase FtsK/SpoIIIE
MSTVVIRRAPRRPAPEIPAGELAVEAPPEIPQATGGKWQQMMMVVPMLGGSVAMALMMGSQGTRGPIQYITGALFGLSSLGMLATSFGNGGPKKSEMMTARREYLRHLTGLRRRVRDTAKRQRSGLFYRHPDPGQLWSTVGSHRLWERRPADGDFAVVRVAVGPQTLATPLVPPVTRPLDELEPMTAGALRRFLDAYSVVPDLPVAVSLRGFARVFLRGGDDGPDADSRGLARAVLTQLATFHAPDDLIIAVAAGPERRDMWEWTKWLPHALHPTRTDALGQVRLVASTGQELEKLLEDVIGNRPRFVPGGGGVAGPHVVIVLDGVHLQGATQLDDGIDGVTVFDLDEKPPRLLDRSLLVLDIRSGEQRKELHTFAMDHAAEVGTPDRLTIVEAEAVARRLAPLRLSAASKAADGPVAVEAGFPELMGFVDPETYPIQQLWAPRPNRDKLRVPIGVGVDGTPIELDLKESAQDGMGPHGLLIGATGSGKSELLRTLVLALAVTHSSETLNFVLIDFKGGATFAYLDKLPHTSAIITNLADELPLVDRMVEAIDGEMKRRQTLLRAAGNYASLRDYEKARAGGAPLEPLPSLMIICDEFSELLSAKPDFIDLFVMIGRVGRSLGVHLLLASQRLEEGRLRGLDTHLSYRIGLRTFSALESRAVLGVPDAYELPRSPGHGYMKFGMEPLQRFRAAYVSGPFDKVGGAGARQYDDEAIQVQSFSTQFVPVVEKKKKAAPKAEKAAGGKSMLDVIVDRMAGVGPPAHQVWLPPLVTSPTLDELLGPVSVDPVRGLTFANPELHGALQVPVALIDKPADQRREVMWMQLSGSGGHVAVVGGPQSGKSTAIRTLITGLALTHTPVEAQVYCLDFGSALGSLRGLPHVGGVASRMDARAVRRTVSEVANVLAEREQLFADMGIDNMESYRRRRAAAISIGNQPDDPYGDVFLVVDGWKVMRDDFEDLEPLITQIATRGLSFGVHVVAGATRWSDFRPAIRDLFNSKLELRLGDPSDSIATRKIAMGVPESTPGRGLVGGGSGSNKTYFHLLTARPELSTMPDLIELSKLSATSWNGPPAPRIRLLPPNVPYTDIDLSRSSGLQIPIGIAEEDMDQVLLDFANEPHFIVFGDSESGKSTFLRQLATSIARRFEPEQARLMVIDYRRGLYDTDFPHRMGYATQAAAALQYTQAIRGYMEDRMPGPDVSPKELRERSWWSGPECFVLVDDYDLVASGSSNPLTPLLEFLPQAADIGLHLILARRSGGASRAAFEPVIQRLRELSSPGLVMSGEPTEGPLVGTVKPSKLPPGRGMLVTRREGTRLIQLADLPAT